MKKCTATLVSLLLVFGLGACLLSLTESFDYDVLFHSNKEYIDLDGQADRVESVDLTKNDTFNDNKDKIKNVDRVGFEADLYTKDGSNAVIDIAFRKMAGDPWIPLLDGASVPGSSTETAQHTITYSDSELLIKNFATFQTMAEGGVMELKIEARDGNDQVRITRLILRITITAGT